MGGVDEIRNISFWCRLQTQLTISCDRIVHEDNSIRELAIIQHLLKSRKREKIENCNQNRQKAKGGIYFCNKCECSLFVLGGEI